MNNWQNLNFVPSISQILYMAPLALPISPTKNTKLGRPCEKDHFMSRN